MDLKNPASELRLAQLSLAVSDLDASQQFYGDLLGLPATRKDDEIEIRWNDFVLVLTERPPAGRGKFRIGFRVTSAADVDTWAARLREAQVDIVGGPTDDGGRRHIFAVDPDNYELEIYFE